MTLNLAPTDDAYRLLAYEPPTLLLGMRLDRRHPHRGIRQHGAVA